MTPGVAPQIAVIFGASGDLTKRKLLPAFWHLWRQGRLPEAFSLVGYARSPMTDDEFREYAFESIRGFSTEPDGEAWEAFAPRLHYFRGAFAETGAMTEFRPYLERLDETFGKIRATVRLADGSTEFQYFDINSLQPIAVGSGGNIRVLSDLDVGVAPAAPSLNSLTWVDPDDQQ